MEIVKPKTPLRGLMASVLFRIKQPEYELGRGFIHLKPQRRTLIWPNGHQSYALWLWTSNFILPERYPLSTGGGEGTWTPKTRSEFARLENGCFNHSATPPFCNQKSRTDCRVPRCIRQKWPDKPSFGVLRFPLILRNQNGMNVVSSDLSDMLPAILQP